jgi:hypothetical protein
MTEPENKKPTPYPLRMEINLKQWAEQRAKQNGRSMNAEIIQILKEAREVEKARAA